jgi:hypothetical protein
MCEDSAYFESFKRMVVGLFTLELHYVVILFH